MGLANIRAGWVQRQGIARSGAPTPVCPGRYWCDAGWWQRGGDSPGTAQPSANLMDGPQMVFKFFEATGTTRHASTCGCGFDSGALPGLGSAGLGWREFLSACSRPPASPPLALSSSLPGALSLLPLLPAVLLVFDAGTTGPTADVLVATNVADASDVASPGATFASAGVTFLLCALCSCGVKQACQAKLPGARLQPQHASCLGCLGLAELGMCCADLNHAQTCSSSWGTPRLTSTRPLVRLQAATTRATCVMPPHPTSPPPTIPARHGGGVRGVRRLLLWLLRQARLPPALPCSSSAHLLARPPAAHPNPSCSRSGRRAARTPTRPPRPAATQRMERWVGRVSRSTSAVARVLLACAFPRPP